MILTPFTSFQPLSLDSPNLIDDKLSSYESIYVFSFDGENFHPIVSPKYSHKGIDALGNYKGRALAVGCNDSDVCGSKTELFDMNALKWSDGPDFSLSSRLV